jgi:hypothetical protein
MIPAPTLAAPFTPGRLLLRTLRVWGRDAHAYTAVALVAGLPLAALELRAGDVPEGSPLLLPLLVATWFTGVLISGALSVGVLRSLGGERPGPGAMLSAAARGLWPIFAVALAYAAAVMLGFFALVLPGVLALLAFYVAVPAIVAEPGLGVEGALRRSFALTRGRRTSLALVVAVLTGIELLAAWSANLGLTHAGASHPVQVAVGALLDGLVGGCTSCCAAVAYYDLRSLSGPRSQAAAKNPSVPWR